VELAGRTDVRTEYRDDATTGAGRIGSGHFSLATELTIQRRGRALDVSGMGRVELWSGTIGGDWLDASSRVNVSRASNRGRMAVYGLLERETMTGLQVDASGLVFARLRRTLTGGGVSVHRTLTERFETDLDYGYIVTRSHTPGVSDMTTRDLRAVGRWTLSEVQTAEGTVTWISLRSNRPGGTDAISIQYRHSYQMTERTRLEGAVGGDLVVERATDSVRVTLDRGMVGRAALMHDLTAGKLSLSASQAVLPSVLGVLVLTRQGGAQLRVALSDYVSGVVTTDLYQSQPLSVGGAERSTAYRIASDVTWTITPVWALAGSYVYLQSHAGVQRSRSHSVFVTLTHAWERRP
jgi:hypothetical protein